VQALGDGVFAAVNEVEESTDFGEGERDQISVDRWRGFRFGGLVGSIVLPIQLFRLLARPFFWFCVR